ncbi:MAG: family 43 glycosylhydrolase [Planctomycetaceae bacterium]|nr:family 43 glycosylhydrolase [Planctomycetaceae bacterium]
MTKMYCPIFCTILLTIFFISTVCAEVPVLIPTEPGVRWITDPTIKPIAEPKMKWGDTERQFDKNGQPIPWAKDPTVVRFNGRYLMYFSRLSGENEKKSGCTFMIGIAESSDLIHWKIVSEIPPFQACDAKGLCAPCGRVWNNKVYLFYQSYGTGAKDGICLAWSDDGIHFTPHSKNPIFKPHGNWTSTRAIDADAFIFKGKLFLYASTRDQKMEFQKTVVATADPEGLKDPENKLGPDAWTQAFDGAILEPKLPWETKCIEATTVCQRGDSLIMFYAGGYNNDPQHIGVAKSNDGIHWTRLWSVPFIPNGPAGQWNSSESGHPGVFIDDDGRTYLFYQGNPDKGRSWFLSQVELGWKNEIPFVLNPQQK